MVGARGTRLPLILAGSAMALGDAADDPARPRTRPPGVLVAGFVVFGFGFGMVNAPITNTAVSGMPRAQAGVAAAIASTSRQFGGSLGVAVIGSAVVSGAGGRRWIRRGEPGRLVDRAGVRAGRTGPRSADHRPVGPPDRGRSGIAGGGSGMTACTAAKQGPEGHAKEGSA